MPARPLYELAAGFNALFDLVLDETMDLELLEEGLQSIECALEEKCAGGLGLVGVSRFGQAGVDPDHLLVLQAQHQHPRIRFPRLRGIQHLDHRGMCHEDPDRFFSAHGPTIRAADTPSED